MLLAASTAWLSACGGLQVNPLVNERRDVHPEQDRSKTLTVMHDMVWYDKSPPAHGLRFPAGVYALEAEDENYWYMRSSTPLELREFRKGGRADSRDLAGGIMIGKYLFRAVPAAGYIDGDGSTRIMIWKLGGEFLSLDGKDWKKSF